MLLGHRTLDRFTFSCPQESVFFHINDLSPAQDSFQFCCLELSAASLRNTPLIGFAARRWQNVCSRPPLALRLRVWQSNLLFGDDESLRWKEKSFLRRDPLPPFAERLVFP